MRSFLFVMTLVVAGCEVDPAQNLVAHWPFETVGGQVVEDASGRGHEAEAAELSVSDGVVGQALNFEGRAENMLSVSLDEPLSDSVTIALWAKREVDRNLALVAHDYPALFLGFHGLQFKWQLRYANGRGAACYADRKHRAELNRWYHIAATFDGFAVRLYVDGEEICSDWTRGGEINTSEAPLTIGGYIKADQTLEDLMVGALDEIRVYRAALSEAQIRQIYQSERPAAIN